VQVGGNSAALRRSEQADRAEEAVARKGVGARISWQLEPVAADGGRCGRNGITS